MMEKESVKYTVNVREMVEFLLRHGDIVPGDAFFSPERALLGADLHRKLQGLFKTEIEGYTAEKGLRFSKEANGVRLEVEGRCDGFYQKDGVLHVDEIKTVDSHFREENGPEPLHTAQAVCYAAILEMLPEYRSEEICIHILYYHVTEKSRTEFRTNFTESELLQYFNGLIDEYIKWISWEANRHNLLQQELCALKFPFPSYRRGQRELAVSVYKTITKNTGSNIYVNAPTGIGKTISVLFPVLKAMCTAESGAEIKKIFYLTATNAGARPPAAAAALLGDQLPELLTISLTSKEKICPMETPDCNPDTCSRARGHYDRINACLYSALLSRRQFTKEEICALSEQHEVCPFELQLDLSLWCDLIIGDYNYLFDPTARLQRYFGELQNSGKKEPYVYLIDEAHNLPDRAREMYTARIQKKPFLELMRLLKGSERKTVKTLRKRASALNSFFLAKEKELEQLPECSEAADPELIKRCADYTESAYELLKENEVPKELRTPILALYFETKFFCDTAKRFDGNYYAFLDRKDRDLSYTLFCANPADLIQACTGNALASVFFSATLLPFAFYTQALGARREEDLFIKIPSPFPPENRLAIFAADVQTTYAKRAAYYEKVAKYIMLIKEYADSACCGRGNFMVFFSSYQYLADVASLLEEDFLSTYVSVQPRSGSPSDREAFLEGFAENPQKIHIGMCVLGGAFSEGIDLPGSRLSGAMIVGVGLPMVCAERELIMKWHEEREEGSGFANAYVYPGINKVIQAAGRVIRTTEDRGFVLFLDSRYFSSRYGSLFPEDYRIKKAKNFNEVKTLLFDLKL